MLYCSEECVTSNRQKIMEVNFQINIKILETGIIQLIEIVQNLPNIQIQITSVVHSIQKAIFIEQEEPYA